jgi:hypothetical protein
VEFALATALRPLIPLTILRWPLPGVLLSMTADIYDWNFLALYTDEEHYFYQSWDRIMDAYFWIISLFIVRKWQDRVARNIAFSLFGFRMIGLVIFLITQDRRFLFFFPNFYDNFLVIYLGYVLIFKQTLLIHSTLDSLVLFPLLMIPKIVHEYFLHYLQIQPWERYDVGALLGLDGIVRYYVNYVTWSGLFYVLPFLAVFLYFCWSQRDPGSTTIDRGLPGATPAHSR